MCYNLAAKGRENRPPFLPQLCEMLMDGDANGVPPVWLDQLTILHLFIVILGKFFDAVYHKAG